LLGVLPEGLQLPIILGFELPNACPNLIGVTLISLARETSGLGAIVGLVVNGKVA
jgi:hypothetical protein